MNPGRRRISLLFQAFSISWRLAARSLLTQRMYIVKVVFRVLLRHVKGISERDFVSCSMMLDRYYTFDLDILLITVVARAGC